MNPKNGILDARTIAKRCATQLQLCCRPRPKLCPFARIIHVRMIASGTGVCRHGHILNRLIKVYCRSSEIDYARYLFDKIPEPDINARTTLITGYAAAGSPKLAREILDSTPLSMRNTFCYNAMIACYSQNDDCHAAVRLFLDMKRCGFKPDDFTFTSVVGAMAMISTGEKQCQQIHCAVIKSGTGYATSVMNALLSVYVKCASSPLASSSSLMDAARRLFDEMSQRDKLTWTTIIAGYVRNHDLDAAFDFLDRMTEKSVVAWNLMISGYVHHGHFREALDLFRKMLLSGIRLDEFTFSSVISACAKAAILRHGKQVHAYILITESNRGRDFSLSVNNALISFYMKFGRSYEAEKVFSDMPMRDAVSWTAMISGYVHHEQFQEALDFFRKLHLSGIELDDVSFTRVISACKNAGLLGLGKQVHAYILRTTSKPMQDFSLSVDNALISLYMKFGRSYEAEKVFSNMPVRDTISWKEMILGYVHLEQFKEALGLFRKMCLSGIHLNGFTFTSVISACANAGILGLGMQVHAYFLRIETNPTEEFSLAVNNALISLYMKFGKSYEAEKVFSNMPMRDTISWTAMISGYVHLEQFKEALDLFRKMCLSGIHLNGFTFSSVLSACANAGILGLGMQVHAYFLRIETNPTEDFSLALNNALIYLYMKFGRSYEAEKVFCNMPMRDTISWTAMISGYVHLEQFKEALDLFRKMCLSGTHLDELTFTRVISACANAGLLGLGKQVHAYILRTESNPMENSALSVNNVLISLYKKLGRSNKARKVFSNMAVRDTASWNAVLSGFVSN